MRQLELASDVFVPDPDRLVVVAYGGGVNTIAAMIRLKRLGVRPTAIVMSDPGSERSSTTWYRDNVMPPWLASVGFPSITVINRVAEGEHVDRAWRLETLYDECMRIGALPSVAYGYKKCSQKYKGDTSRWWIARQPWALAEWAEVVETIEVPLKAGGHRKEKRPKVTGRQIYKVIGYDVDERSRVMAAFQNPWENSRLVPWYPLVEANMGREECLDLIRDEGLEVIRNGKRLPSKSACTMCPNNTYDEWEEVRDDEPEAFAAAVALSRRASANVEAPDVVGLMRCNPAGKRQLHVWADGGYPELIPARSDEDDNEAMPCECAL